MGDANGGFGQRSDLFWLMFLTVISVSELRVDGIKGRVEAERFVRGLLQ